MARELTKRQGEILQFIIRCIRDEGMPPTIAEVGAEFGISSTNGVHDHLAALERKGYIERENKARGIRVTSQAAIGLYQNESGVAPLVGTVAAGSPILAEENVEDYVAVSSDLAREGVFCLNVRGDSMIEDGIFDGDIVVVDQKKDPRKGAIVVALIDGDATVKRYFPQGQTVELRPANASMKPIVVPLEDLSIQGVVVGLQRSY